MKTQRASSPFRSFSEQVSYRMVKTPARDRWQGWSPSRRAVLGSNFWQLREGQRGELAPTVAMAKIFARHAIDY